MVRSKYLSPEHLIIAMKNGDFYASSCVTLNSIEWDTKNNRLQIAIQPTTDAEYETHFIVVDRPKDGSVDDSIPLSDLTIDQLPKAYVKTKVQGITPSYQLDGTELYVRAVVFSNQAPADPVWQGQQQQAWTQPVGWKLED